MAPKAKAKVKAKPKIAPAPLVLETDGGNFKEQHVIASTTQGCEPYHVCYNEIAIAGQVGLFRSLGEQIKRNTEAGLSMKTINMENQGRYQNLSREYGHSINEYA